ncbi:hypothetical protein ACLBKT_09160 [Erythrobacter sp. W302b]|uniref:hypothetical protein n=1 Tax=Erythrobacter sp. W302b TaxID=3389874 RepID=UPI00396B1A9F
MQFDTAEGKDQMQEMLREVLNLQLEFSSENTPAMERRGQLVRNLMPEELRQWIAVIGAVSSPVTECRAKPMCGNVVIVHPAQQHRLGHIAARCTTNGKDRVSQLNLLPTQLVE